MLHIDYLSELCLRLGENNVQTFSNKKYARICCPFHDDSTPSCLIVLKHGGFYCLGCDTKGSFFKLLSAIDGIDVVDVKTKFDGLDDGSTILYDTLQSIDTLLLDNVETTKQKRQYITEVSFNKKFVSLKDTPGELYVRGRLINQKSISTFNLRWGGDAGKWRNRIIMPVYDGQRKIISFISRWAGNTTNDKKARNFKNHSPRITLYGIHTLRKATLPYLLLVEGAFDAIYLQQFGIAAVGTLGTGYITQKQIEVLLHRTSLVFLCFDSDAKGKKTTKREYERLRELIPVMVLDLPSKKDPNDLSHEEVLQLRKKIRRLLCLT